MIYVFLLCDSAVNPKWEKSLKKCTFDHLFLQDDWKKIVKTPDLTDSKWKNGSHMHAFVINQHSQMQN